MYLIKYNKLTYFWFDIGQRRRHKILSKSVFFPGIQALLSFD